MIIWLPSYPKSGNTWVRLLIANYLKKNKGDLFSNINYIQDFPREKYFDFIDLNKEFKNIDTKEVYKYFIKAQDRINLDKKNKIFKTHSCLGKIGDYKFTDKNNTLGFIYLIRDPRSVVISMTYQYEISLINAAELIINKNNFAIEQGYKIKTLWSSWKLNYLSWKKSP